MRLLTPLCILLLLIGVHISHAANSAYANAALSLTSTSQVELATASSTTPAGYATAAARPGFMQNSVMTTASFGGPASLQNETVSGFSDQLTITDPGMTGQSGSLQFEFLVDGAESFAATSALASITAKATLTAPGNNDIYSFTQDSSGNITGTDFLGITQTVTVPFTFGTPFNISLYLDITALVDDLSSGGSGSATGNFTTTAGAMNVTALVAGSEVPASDYSVRSASGKNYQTLSPVPEPADWALTAWGLAGLSFLALRRRAR